MERLKTPEFMVEEGKFCAFGKFTEPFREVNMLEADIRIAGRRAGKFLKNLRLKEWEHFGLICEDYYFGMVIFDAKYLGNVFFYAFNRKTGEFFEHKRTSIGAPLRIARELWHSECYFKHIGFEMEFLNRLDSGYHRLRVEIARTHDKPKVSADVRIHEDLSKFEPLVSVSPIGSDRALYTHKIASSAEGFVRIDDREVRLDAERDFGLMDVQKTYYPYNTFWNWTTFAWRNADGKIVALNLCQNFIEEDEKYNENCLWLDGKIVPLSAARFDFDKNDVLKPWKITTTGGEVDLIFKPLGERKGKISLGFLMSNFHQPFGEFSGVMRAPGKEAIEIDGAFGVCEHHLARF